MALEILIVGSLFCQWLFLNLTAHPSTAADHNLQVDKSSCLQLGITIITHFSVGSLAMNYSAVCECLHARITCIYSINKDLIILSGYLIEVLFHNEACSTFRKRSKFGFITALPPIIFLCLCKFT